METKKEKVGSTFYLNNKKDINLFNRFKKIVDEEYKGLTDFYKETIKKYTVKRYFTKIDNITNDYINYINSGVPADNIYINYDDEIFYITPQNQGIKTIFNNSKKFKKDKLILTIINILKQEDKDFFEEVYNFYINT